MEWLLSGKEKFKEDSERANVKFTLERIWNNQLKSHNFHSIVAVVGLLVYCLASISQALKPSNKQHLGKSLSSMEWHNTLLTNQVDQ